MLPRDSKLYLILDKEACPTGRILNKVLLSAIKGGIDLVELRDKNSTTKDIVRYAEKLLKICRKNKVPFIINDRLDIALALDADGLHLGQDDMPVSVARKLFGKSKIIGLSCHSIADLKNAQKEDADYLGFGPVFRTKTKPKAVPLGITSLKMAYRLSKKPIFAIGGITNRKLDKLNKIAGLKIAVCRQICSSRNPRQATRKLKELI